MSDQPTNPDQHAPTCPMPAGSTDPADVEHWCNCHVSRSPGSRCDYCDELFTSPVLPEHHFNGHPCPGLRTPSPPLPDRLREHVEGWEALDFKSLANGGWIEGAVQLLLEAAEHLRMAHPQAAAAMCRCGRPAVFPANDRVTAWCGMECEARHDTHESLRTANPSFVAGGFGDEPARDVHPSPEPPIEGLAPVWRVGRNVGNTIYLDDEFVGSAVTPTLAARIVADANVGVRTRIGWERPMAEGKFVPLMPHGPSVARSAFDALDAIGVPRVEIIVKWLRSLDGLQDPKRLADEIERTPHPQVREGVQQASVPSDETAKVK